MCIEARGCDPLEVIRGEETGVLDFGGEVGLHLDEGLLPALDELRYLKRSWSGKRSDLGLDVAVCAACGLQKRLGAQGDEVVIGDR